MGYYINKIPKGAGFEELPEKGKADEILKKLPGAIEIPIPTYWCENLVCIVQNYGFDAAGYAFNAEELAEFKRPDGRIKRWLIVPDAEKLSQ